jgi:starvation-inducible outer membrane lipoprotein
VEWNIMRARLLYAMLLLPLLAACRSGPRVIVDPQGVDQAAYQRDLADCTTIADQVRPGQAPVPAREHWPAPSSAVQSAPLSATAARPRSWEASALWWVAPGAPARAPKAANRC